MGEFDKWLTKFFSERDSASPQDVADQQKLLRGQSHVFCPSLGALPLSECANCPSPKSGSANACPWYVILQHHHDSKWHHVVLVQHRVGHVPLRCAVLCGCECGCGTAVRR